MVQFSLLLLIISMLVDNSIVMLLQSEFIMVHFFSRIVTSGHNGIY